MFSQKKIKIAFSIFIFTVGIFALIQMPLIGLPVLGGVITQGILGGFSGKVGPVVGGKWKDIDYMRGYVVPANPNTIGQQAVRTKFSLLVSYARQLLTSLLQVYWDPFVSNMSGYNRWISLNYAETNSQCHIDLSCVMSKGTLQPIKSLTSAVVTGTNLVVTFIETAEGNGLATDSIFGVVFNVTNDQFYFINPSKTRADSPTTFVVPAGTTEEDLFWLFLGRGTGSDFIVSDSKSISITVP